MNEKRFYWLKLKRDFFKRHDIRIVEEMPNGKDYILFYLKMLLESIDHNGALRFSETIPYNEQMLAIITNTNIDIVRAAMDVFKQLNMIEVCDDSTIYMNEVEKLIGSETAAAERKRRSRAAAAIPANCDNVTTASQNSHIEIEKEKEKEKETESEKEKEKKTARHKYGEYNNVLLSDSDFEKLKTEFPADYQERIERLSSYKASTGKTYKNDLATIRNWARRDTEKKQATTTGGNNPFVTGDLPY